MTSLDQAADISDLRRLARKRLPRFLFDFIDGGAGAEVTLRANEGDFGAWGLAPRVGVDVAERHTRTDIVGYDSALPLMLAPTGLAGLFRPGGEGAAARAARDAGIPFCLSTNSVASIEELATQAPGGDRWFQYYFLKDEGLTDRMLERAREHGYRVLCLTLDLPVQGRRHRDVRNGFTVPPRLTPQTVLDAALHPAWSLGYLRHGVSFGNFETAQMGGGISTITQHIAALCDSGADWDTVRHVMAKWDGPVVVKGVLHPDDARRAVDLGAATVIVSNHGGRQLDAVPSAVAALPAVAKAVAGRAQVLLDGGVRRGSDIVVARALGADACMIGRPFLWGLAAAGEAGVTRAIEMLAGELDTALALLGRPDVGEIDAEAVFRR
ncbi:alpha-hydroxy acid oxidase [Salipiger mucosus]|uniref:L-lactate dehydrogenase n=1 Tax=Salipiger mucosus DSM 16094 TaxID=1123237 RepID=S9S6H0_9RHOB|nr:alpha-hydroxy acid oxidase [Salipiger mucosus]EPX85800.1 L-lactate dehydrogenase [Salipiger mucosus DSM 16094]